MVLEIVPGVRSRRRTPFHRNIGVGVGFALRTYSPAFNGVSASDGLSRPRPARSRCLGRGSLSSPGGWGFPSIVPALPRARARARLASFLRVVGVSESREGRFFFRPRRSYSPPKGESVPLVRGLSYPPDRYDVRACAAENFEIEPGSTESPYWISSPVLAPLRAPLLFFSPPFP